MKLRVNEENAKLWKRALAYIIDAIIVNIIIIWPFQKTLDRLMDTSNTLSVYSYLKANSEVVKNLFPEITILFIIIAALTIAYWATLEYITGQSIGKMIMKVYVKSDGNKLKLGGCIVRNISKISGLLLIIDCIGLISNNQRFLERLTKTRVVEKRFTI